MSKNEMFALHNKSIAKIYMYCTLNCMKMLYTLILLHVYNMDNALFTTFIFQLLFRTKTYDQLTKYEGLFQIELPNSEYTVVVKISSIL